ncbi:MAG: GNAT family N-acetyltransferase [Candidatus Aminicenantes bacterium]|nr:GNAT family N-acetyltransferase [Candidatus Aminicenantes bacterium]
MITALIIRPYKKKDLKRCREIAHTEFNFDDYLSLPNYHFVVVANDEGLVAGYGVIHIWEWNRSAWIVDINVDPPLRNRKYGRALVNGLAEIAKSNGCTVLIDYFPTDYEFAFFYFKLGFKMCGYNSRLFYDEDPEKRMGIIMGLDLV